MSATIQRMIGHTRRVHTERAQLVAPGHGCALILKRTNRLPPVKARIANRHRRVFGRTTQEANTTHLQEGTQASLATYGLWVARAGGNRGNLMVPTPTPFALKTLNATATAARTPFLTALAADAGSRKSTPGAALPRTAEEETAARLIACAFVVLRPWRVGAIVTTPPIRTAAF
jgi:hypothetical protein